MDRENKIIKHQYGFLGFKTSSYILQGETIVSLKQRNQKMINNDNFIGES